MPLTLEDIAEMINSNKKEILNKVDEIVEDVKDVKTKVKDLTNRADAQEATNTKVNEKIDLLQSQISSLKEMSEGDLGTRLVSPRNKQSRSYATVAAAVTTPWPRAAESEHVTTPTDPIQSDHDKQVTEIIDLARRTVGLYKIDNDDLKRMRLVHFGGATTEDEEKQLAVREYLKCELKFDLEEINNMEVENIFIPARDKGEPQSLNVTFKSVSSVSRIYEKTRIMRKESRVMNYIPRQFQDRLSAISSIDYNIRADKTYQTRIKMGFFDLELHKKLRGSRKWERVPLPSNLPPVDLSSRPAPALSGSPPPGRPGHQYSRDNTNTKRGRDSTGSNVDQNSPKVVKLASEVDKNNTEEEDESFIQKVEKADLVSEGKNSPDPREDRDPGMVTSVQGTPAKLQIQGKFQQQQSPIITRSTKKN